MGHRCHLLSCLQERSIIQKLSPAPPHPIGGAGRKSASRLKPRRLVFRADEQSTPLWGGSASRQAGERRSDDF